jgi:hypothetical protein
LGGLTFFKEAMMNKQMNWSKWIRGIVCVVILMGLQGQVVQSPSPLIAASSLENTNSLESGEYVPGVVLVCFEPSVEISISNKTRFRANVNTVQSKLEQLEVQEIESIFQNIRTNVVDPPAELLQLYKLTLPLDSNVPQVARELEKMPYVMHAGPDYLVQLQAVPNDPHYEAGRQWGLERINVPQAWGIAQDSSAIKIAILDSGIDMNHFDLDSKIQGGYDYISDDDNPHNDYYHGNMIALIAAAETNNGQGMAGVSWHSPIVPFRVCNDSHCPVSKRIPAIYHAANTEGVKVINMSLGSVIPYKDEKIALQYAYEQGVTVIAAAGNNNAPFEFTKEPLRSVPKYPASFDNVISVSATNYFDELARFSSYGNSVSLSAPGKYILFVDDAGSYRRKDGTSFAAPFVSGVAALVYSVLSESYQHPDVVERILEATVTDLGKSGWDDKFGWGLLNAHQAVYEAANPPHLDFYAPLHYSDGADHSAWMTLRIRDIETQELLYEGRIAQNSEGRPFDLPKLYGIPTGDYDIIIKAPASLSKLVSNVHLTAGSTTFVDFTDDGNSLYFSQGGDFNNDDRVNVLDYNYMASVYFTDDWLADLSGDGIVSLKDMSRLFYTWNNRDLGDDYGNTFDKVVNQTAELQTATGSASLSISPSTGTYNVGQEFDVQIQIDTAGENIVGADLVLRYDPLALAVVEITEGTVFPSNAVEEVDTNMCEVVIGAYDDSETSFSGTGTLATIRFRVLAGETPTTLRIRFRPADTTDSNLAEDSTNQEILGAVGHGRFDLVGTPARSDLGGFFTAPNGDYLAQMENFIAFRPNLATSALVEEITFEAYYDAEWHALEVDRNVFNGWSTYWHTEMVTDQIISLRANVLDLNGITTAFTVDNLYLDRVAPATTLTVPTFLPDNGEFVVSWQGQDNLTGVVSYDVQYKDGEDGSWVEWKAATTSTSANFTGESGHNYYFQARACDVAGNEEAFSEEVAVLGDPPTVYLPLIVQN